MLYVLKIVPSKEYVEVQVEADSKSEAYDKFYESMLLQQYVWDELMEDGLDVSDYDEVYEGEEE